MIETALVLMVFFILVFALIDFSWLLFNLMSMQNAVSEAGRLASTGQHLTDPQTGLTMSRTDSITQVLNQYKEGTTIEKVTISSVGGGVGSAGGPSDTVTIQAVCDVSMLTSTIGKLFGSDNRFHFTASTTVKNEPFPASQTN